MEFMNDRYLSVATHITPKASDRLRIATIGPNVNRTVCATFLARASPSIGGAVNQLERLATGIADELVVGCNAIEKLPPLCTH